MANPYITPLKNEVQFKLGKCARFSFCILVYSLKIVFHFTEKWYTCIIPLLPLGPLIKVILAGKSVYFPHKTQCPGLEPCFGKPGGHGRVFVYTVAAPLLFEQSGMTLCVEFVGGW